MEIRCGDCQDVISETADLIFTSPPYSIGSKAPRKDGERRFGRGNHNGGYALVDTHTRFVCCQGFDMMADEVVTRCAVEVLRRAGRQISSLPGLLFKSECEPVLAVELNNVRSCWRARVPAPLRSLY
jgi:hypothetical protein